MKCPKKVVFSSFLLLFITILAQWHPALANEVIYPVQIFEDPYSQILDKSSSSSKYRSQRSVQSNYQLYNDIYDALVNVKDEINVSAYSLSSSVVFDTRQKVIDDHPEIFYFTNPGSDFYSNGRLLFKYLYDESEVLLMKEKLDEKVNLIIGEVIVAGQSQFEMELALHNYIVLNSEYDLENYENSTLPDLSYTAYGTLVNGIAVCDGYAKAIKLLLNQVEIECIRVVGTGNGGSHAWDLVEIDGSWYHLDATWDDPVPDQKGRIGYSYYNVSDVIMRKDHSWNAIDYPAATSQTYMFMSDMNTAVISDDYFFYSSKDDDDRLYKVRLNGTDKIKVFSDRAPYFAIYGDFIYYSNYSQGGYLFKVNKDGTGREQLNSKHSIVESIKKGVLYYRDEDSGNTLSITIETSIPVTSVLLNFTELSIPAGRFETLVETVQPKNASNLAVSWESNNPDVARISNRQISAIAPGTAIITVKTQDGQKTAQCVVTVYNATKKDMPVNPLTWDQKKGSKEKIWTVTFNEEVDPVSVNANNIYVTDENEYSFSTNISVEGKTLLISPAYKYNVSKRYYINLTSGLKSKSGKSIKSLRMPFLVE